MIESSSIISGKITNYLNQFKRYLDAIWSDLNQDCYDCHEHGFEFFAFGRRLCYSCCVNRILEDGMPSDLLEGERYPIIPEMSLKSFGFDLSLILESHLQNYDKIKDKAYEFMRKGRLVIIQCYERDTKIQGWIYTK